MSRRLSWPARMSMRLGQAVVKRSPSMVTTFTDATLCTVNPYFRQ